MIKILPRAETTIVNAYLAPVIENYISSVKDRISKGRLKIMTSSGGLVGFDLYQAKDSLLSGPAGGVVGAAWSAVQSGFESIITFDMGGTSTDVSRFDGDFDYQFESKVGDAHIFSPSLAIKTVAAGGGSICGFDRNKFTVGPESAGANPGPACYGSGGPLTITDVNLLLGRLDHVSFGLPIDRAASQSKLDELKAQMSSDCSSEDTLYGFLEIANEKMADAIKSTSINKGYDTRNFALLSFGGAGGQHACRIADLLQINQIIIPYDAGLLSALGMGYARIERFAEIQILSPLNEVGKKLPKIMQNLDQKALNQLHQEGFERAEIEIRSRKLFIRFSGQDTPLEIPYDDRADIENLFRSRYESLFGHWIDGRQVEVESARVVGSSKSKQRESQIGSEEELYSPAKAKSMSAYIETEWIEIPVFRWEKLDCGANIRGPALITSQTSTTFLDSGWTFRLDLHNHGILTRQAASEHQRETNQPEEIQLELFTNRFEAIAHDMGQLLQRTSFSVNIKERLDFSCAILNREGELVVNAPHIPVHLGSLGICTRKILETMELGDGDVVITNHPSFGGSHLPDITLVAPVFLNNGVLLGYVANRAHHAEIGGKRPGSMPPDAASLEEEGVVIRPTLLYHKGTANWQKIEGLLLQDPYPTRSPQENLADLKAALAAIRLGQETLRETAILFGDQQVQYYMDKLQNYASECLANSLLQIKDGLYTAQEFLDDGTCIKTSINVRDESANIDFNGSSGVHPGNLNANPSIVISALLYVLRLLINRELPLNEGLMKTISLSIPSGFLNPEFPPDPSEAPAVVGGNTEVSQRITDTLIKAFGLAACRVR